MSRFLKFIKKFPLCSRRFGGGGGCFARGSLIETRNGQVPIEDIKIGDTVLAFSESGDLHYEKVTETFEHFDYPDTLLRVTLEDDTILLVTDNHWMFDKNGKFIEMGKFSKGDVLINKDEKEIVIKSIEKLNVMIPIYTLTVNKYHTFIVNGIKAHNKGKGKSGSKVTISYHSGFSIAECQCWEKSTIIFESRLGNTLMIGDGVTTTATIPNYWQKKYTFQSGWGYARLYPQTIRLYSNTINNELTTGWSYDIPSGVVTFDTAPANRDIIAFSCTYDPEQPNLTTFNANFYFKELLQRVGLKHYKYEDTGLDTYEKTCRMSKGMMDELWKPIMPGTVDIIYNPFINIGQTIYIHDPKSGFSNVVFVKSFNKTFSKTNSNVKVDTLTFPESLELEQLGDASQDGRFKLMLPDFMISFIDETSDDSESWSDALFCRIDVLDQFGKLNAVYKNDTKFAIILDDKVREFPSTENTKNNAAFKNKRGILSQYYSMSMRKHASGEFADDTELKTYFPNFFATTPRLFQPKDVVFKIKDDKTGQSVSVVRTIWYGKKKPFSGYYVPIAPMPAFITFWKNRDHILFLDKDKTLWAIDLFGHSDIITTSTQSFVDSNTICMTSDGNNIYIIDDEAQNVKKYNEATDDWTTMVANDCLCNHPDTLICTKEGFKAIKNLQVNESVLTHKGTFQKIEKVFKRPIKEEIIEIKPFGEPSIKLTNEHPVYIYNKTTKKFVWKNAEEIKKSIYRQFKSKKFLKENQDDYLVFTFPDNEIDIKEYDLLSLIDFNLNKYRKNPMFKSFNTNIKINDDFMKFLGFYLSEGNVSRNTVSLTFGKHEKQYIKESQLLIKKIFKIVPNIRETNTGIQIILVNKIIANAIKKLFGHKSYLKTLPDWIMLLPKSKQKILIEYCAKGDGLIRKHKLNNNKTSIEKRLFTVSPKLALNFKILLLRQRIKLTFNIKPPSFQHIMGRKKLTYCRQGYVFQWYNNSKPNIKIFIDNNYLTKIHRINKIKYDGKVFNLKIEKEETYTNSSFITHNCGSKVFNPITPTTDENGAPILYVRANEYLEVDGTYYDYINFLKVRDDAIVKTKWQFNMGTKILSGAPFIYRGVLYHGRVGFNLKDCVSYEGTHNYSTEASCPNIIDNSNLVFKDIYGTDVIKVHYMINKQVDELWCIGAPADYMDIWELNQVRLIGKKWAIGKRSDNIYDTPFDATSDSSKWSRMAEFGTTDDTDSRSWDIYGFYVAGGKPLFLIKGTEPARLIKDFKYGIASFNPEDKTLNFFVIKYFGDTDYANIFEADLISTIFFKDKVLVNWKDWETLLHDFQPIFSVQGI